MDESSLDFQLYQALFKVFSHPLFGMPQIKQVCREDASFSWKVKMVYLM